ncbi:hypothetical protein SAMN02745975_02510 [Geosporobacter subterraneus DSM 17957]|uniref:Uncharacterized protein n=1 Tax=Geosporobacter subterraneus DSM 17957 TaxID=1121919 RepID=A0A1M6KUY2_9FIRM|nr:hypothetical protein [Geosporobacter subterraneus]SHJ62746.1 hypothetical protein SAMN02745975_02510 [Geosporobacter subterraneus DSM 17957]
MKEFNVIIDNTIKLVGSNMVEEIIRNTGYFDSVEDISGQLNVENTMGFDVFSIVPMVHEEGDMRNQEDRMIPDQSKRMNDLLYQSVENYLDIAVEEILDELRIQFAVQNVTSNYSIIDVEDGVNALLYFYFGDYYLH